MERLPPPGRPLPALRRGDTISLGPDDRLWHVYRQGGQHGTSWDEFRHVGPVGTMRFDHHVPPRKHQDRAVFYAAFRRPRRTGSSAFEACLAEAFQDTRTIDTVDREPWVVEFAPVRAITLLDVTSSWVTRAGGNQAICSGRRQTARDWARAIYDEYPNVDGVHYTASTYGPGHCAALFERASDAVPATPLLHRPLSDPGFRPTIDRIADALGYALI